MAPDPCSGERINLYSLVTYLPDPLGSFIDQLRCELVPGCSLRAHVTILPPRCLQEPVAAGKQIGSTLELFEPFEVQLNEVEIFSKSNVVYLGLARGLSKLEALHTALNCADVFFDEPFEYHPHITLAQQIAEEQISDVFHHARYRWAEYTHQRSFPVDRAVYVQAITLSNWVDLEEFRLGSAARQ